MNMTSSERLYTATKLRTAALCDYYTDNQYGETGFQETLRRITGTDDQNRKTLYSRLAELVDPVCTASGKGGGPLQCSECGRTLDGHENFCPGCGSRIVYWSDWYEEYGWREECDED